MALFKILKGNSGDLGKSSSTNSATTHEGWCYFTPDTGCFYIDIEDGESPIIGTNRIQLNAGTAFNNVYSITASTTNGALVYTTPQIPGSTTQPIEREVTVYTHPTGNGNNHIPVDGTSNQWLKYSSAGTAIWSNLPTASTNAAGIIQIGTGATNAAAGDHTHATTMATSSGTSSLTLAFDTKYQLTAGGTNYIFQMPANPNTDHYDWSDITNKPNTATRWPSWTEVTSKPTSFTPSSHTHAWANISDPPATATSWPTWDQVTSKPSTFAPSAHSHDQVVLVASNTAFTDTTSVALNGFSTRFYSVASSFSGQPSQYGFLMTLATGNSAAETHQFFVVQPNGDLYHRGTNGDSHASPPAFRTILDSGNYSSYTVTKTGAGASGSWGISVTGSAGSVAWANVTGKPTTFTPATHNHNRAGVSRSWINGRDTAIIRTTSYAGYDAILSMKTTNGAWDLGVYTSDILYFVYTPDAQYNAGTNSGYNNSVNIRSNGVLYGACWNDYAECRWTETVQPGYCVTETAKGIMVKTNERLQPGCRVTSDTFGACIGQTAKAQTPIAISGRVLVYPYKNKNEYKLGDAVCSAPGGTVDIMTREEIMMYPERIIGTVSEIPDYETWSGGAQNGDSDIKVNGRIWIYVR